MAAKFLGWDRITLVLICTRNPLNIGAAARAMSNFGFRDLRVVNPYQVAFREARSAVGATPLLRTAREYDNIAEALADCSLVVGTTAARNRKLGHKLRGLREGARLIRKRLPAGRVAILFGSEKRGLSNDDISYCHWLLRIPTREEHPSMNLAQAVAVCLYELSRETSIAWKAEKAAATAAALDRLATILLETLQTSGYATTAASKTLDHRVRKLIRRTALSDEDAQLWSGMLRQMLWKMRSRDQS
jgi:tRNA/rRNA methyltransferase